MLVPRVYICSGNAWVQQYRRSATSRLLVWTLCITLFVWTFAWHSPRLHKAPKPTNAHSLVEEYIEYSRGDGGRWYVPGDWLHLDDRFLQPYPDIEHYMDIRNPRTPAEAAQLALELCMRRNLYLRNTNIPLIVHQTWKDVDAAQWNAGKRDAVDAWLKIATGKAYPDLPKMAYVLWDDHAVNALVELYENSLWQDFKDLPRPVEKADIFRVAVLKWFGGVYADIDTDPLEHPYHWVKTTDIENWKDSSTAQTYHPYEPSIKSYKAPDSSPFRPHTAPDSPVDATPASYKDFMALFAPNATEIGAIFGLEADTPANADDYWRAGYSYPVQLTNWALAMAPHHPVGKRFLDQVTGDIRANTTRLGHIDPLDLTGPPALTRAVKEWSERETPNFTWESVSGCKDPSGGRGKTVAGDVMVLPITGFSPGRGRLHNMGSQSINNANARLRHLAQGSWRHTSMRVQAGKLCRTLFGLCRDWSKVP